MGIFQELTKKERRTRKKKTEKGQKRREREREKQTIVQRGVKIVHREGEGNKGGKENGMEWKGEGGRKEKGKGVLKEENGRKDCANRRMY